MSPILWVILVPGKLEIQLPEGLELKLWLTCKGPPQAGEARLPKARSKTSMEAGKI